jgi:hypothetical protein
LEYAIDVENWIETVDLTLQLSDTKASYVITKDSELIIGPNEILIKVYSESAEERIYKIVVNRQGDNPVVAIERIIELLPRIEAEHIEITSKDPTSLSKEIWNELAATDKLYTFNIRNGANETLYMWLFDGSKISANDWINFEVIFNSDNREQIRKLLNYRESILLNLAHSGEISDSIKLRINVSSEYKDESVLYLYYFDAQSGKLEDKSKEFVVKEGFVELDIDHASQYVLTPVKLSVFDNMSMLFIGVIALLTLLLLLVFISMSFKVKKLKRRLARKTESAA